MDALSWILESSLWPPRRLCGDWSALHINTTIVASLIIAVGYWLVSLLFGLLYVRRNRTPLMSGRGATLIAFAAVFVTCGTGHAFNGAMAFYYPSYRLFTAWDVLTAAVVVIGFPRLARDTYAELRRAGRLVTAANSVVHSDALRELASTNAEFEKLVTHLDIAVSEFDR